MNPRHTMIVLGVCALASAALAAFALHQQALEGAPPFQTGEFLPGFAAQVKNAARIHIVSSDGTFDIVNTDKGWVLPERGNYPADFDEVRHTLIGLAALQIIEPKTARPDWLHYIGLETPHTSNAAEKNNAVLMTVSDAKGQALASLIMGNMENIGDPNGTAGLFVRRPGENQSWLTRAVFVPHGMPAAWMLLKVLDVDAARLKDITIAPLSGKPFTVARAHPSDADFSLTPALKTASPQAVNAIPALITAFDASDVRSAAGLDFSKAVHVTAHMFDGLVLSLDGTQIGADVWVRLNASTAPDAAPGIASQAQALDSRVTGWAYKLAPDKGRLLMATEPMLGGSPR